MNTIVPGRWDSSFGNGAEIIHVSNTHRARALNSTNLTHSNQNEPVRFIFCNLMLYRLIISKLIPATTIFGAYIILQRLETTYYISDIWLPVLTCLQIMWVHKPVVACYSGFTRHLPHVAFFCHKIAKL